MIRFFLYWMYVFTLTAVAALMTSFFAPGVMGSGIPVRDGFVVSLLGGKCHDPIMCTCNVKGLHDRLKITLHCYRATLHEPDVILAGVFMEHISNLKQSWHR